MTWRGARETIGWRIYFIILYCKGREKLIIGQGINPKPGSLQYLMCAEFIFCIQATTD